jgi:hypothetical protein
MNCLSIWGTQIHPQFFVGLEATYSIARGIKVQYTIHFNCNTTINISIVFEKCSVSNGIRSQSSLKQQSAGRHVAPLGHIILIPIQPVFAISP